MKSMKKSMLFLMILFNLSVLNAQNNDYTQAIRGQITDKQTNTPLPGASIVIIGSDPLVGTSTDENGYYSIENVPIGRVSLNISYIGYISSMISNLNLTSGKEVLVNVELKEKVIMKDEVVISASRDKTGTINEMATISARTFTVEESQRYAGARNDVARMAANYAGVSSYNDATNDIVIRGNSPDGLLWNLEGIPIPNPNHFGQIGATGGPVSMLNNNVLSNSDFLTGAFPGEYGNAISGVFDLKYRPGNYDKHEFLGQLGFNGFELGAEGPLSRRNNSSYLVNYRYSTLGVASALGIEFGTGASIPYYQDLSYNLIIPVKKSGRFQLFGLGGLNHIAFENSKLDTNVINESLYGTGNMNVYSRGKYGVSGVSYTQQINSTTYAKISFAGTYFSNSEDVDTLIGDIREPVPLSRANNQKYDFIIAGSINKKINSGNFTRIGFIIDRIGFKLADSAYHFETASYQTTYESHGNTVLYRAYAEWQHRFSDRLEFNTGIHFQALALNNAFSIEPRASLKWTFRPGQSFNLGYGLHSITQQPSVYFRRMETTNGAFEEVNKTIGFTRAHHFIAGYDLCFARNFRLKSEAYYQYLFDVPVETTPSNFSTLNNSSMQYFSYDTLVNNGTGRNYGIEITLEKFLSKGFYFLVTGSVFDSKYKGSDGILRSTAFDSRYVTNFLGGKEFRLNSRNEEAKFKTWLVVDGKLTAAGGIRYTPVDFEKSKEEGHTVYNQELAFTKQFDDYFRLDMRVAFRLDSKKISHELAFDVQNITNHKNPIYMKYNPDTGQEEFMYQLGIFPMVQYRINF
jgi:hypothetical protein